MFGLTIDQTIQFLTAFMLGALLLSAWFGWRQIRSASRLPFFMLRQRRISQGWRLLILALIFAVAGLFITSFGRQIAYTIVPPTPSITPTPTITLTPTASSTSTITPIPSITPTATITPTPTITSIPEIPSEIGDSISSQVTPPSQAALSEIEVTRELGLFNQPIASDETFELPIGRLYGTFTYDNLLDGVQWTSLWLFDGAIVCQESIPWNGGTGGYGYTECELPIWEIGEYEIQMYIGIAWAVSTRFEIVAINNSTSTAIPTATP
jgi:hypothetical protein